MVYKKVLDNFMKLPYSQYRSVPDAPILYYSSWEINSSADQIFDLDIEFSSFNTRLILNINQISRLGLGTLYKLTTVLTISLFVGLLRLYKGCFRGSH